jgi:hypothetical protein
LGFTDAQERAGFSHGPEIESLSNTLAPLTSAIHAEAVVRDPDGNRLVLQQP